MSAPVPSSPPRPPQGAPDPGRVRTGRALLWQSVALLGMLLVALERECRAPAGPILTVGPDTGLDDPPVALPGSPPRVSPAG